MSTSRWITATRVSVSIAFAMAVATASAGTTEAVHHESSSTVMVGGRTIHMSAANKAQLQKLQRAHIPIFYPTVVPKRYSLKDIVLEKETNPDGLDYSIQFAMPNKHYFSIESALTGIGDGPGGDRELKGHSKIFGDFQIDVMNPGSEGNGSKEIYYISSWLEYRESPKARPVNYHLQGDGITDKEAVEITESLAPVSLTSAK